MARAQKGAEQLLAAAGLGEPAIAQVVQSIMAANESEIARSAASSPFASGRPAEPAAAPPSRPARLEPQAPEPEQRERTTSGPLPRDADRRRRRGAGEPAEGGEPEPEK